MKSSNTRSSRAANLPDKTLTYRKIAFAVLLTACLTPFVSPPLALLTGIIAARFTGHPYSRINHRLSHVLLQFSVVGLGFGMNVHTALEAGKQGFLFTVASIAGTLLAGYYVGKFLKIHKKTSYLISVGTAICGGSAIAAVAPVIKPDEEQMSIALGTIFILNAVALFIFPVVGHLLNLSPSQFGIWSAIAIQDTSSVVGAAGKYGTEALQIATTVKLTRALWIIPVSLISSRLFHTKGAKPRIPYFIALFVVAILLNTYVPGIHALSSYITAVSKAGLTLTLFLIGSGLSKQVVSAVGWKPVLQGIILWVMIALVGLWAVMSFIN